MKTAINTSARFIPVPPLRRQNRRISSWLWWIGAILTARRLLRETLYLIGFGVLTIGLYAT